MTPVGAVPGTVVSGRITIICCACPAAAAVTAGKANSAVEPSTARQLTVIVRSAVATEPMMVSDSRSRASITSEESAEPETPAPE